MNICFSQTFYMWADFDSLDLLFTWYCSFGWKSSCSAIWKGCGLSRMYCSPRFAAQWRYKVTIIGKIPLFESKMTKNVVFTTVLANNGAETTFWIISRRSVDVRLDVDAYKSFCSTETMVHVKILPCWPLIWPFLHCIPNLAKNQEITYIWLKILFAGPTTRGACPIRIPARVY